jgi:hypothetical protein
MITNTNINKENLIKTPTYLYYILPSIIFFLILMIILIVNNFNIFQTSNNLNKSEQQIIADTFIILFFSMLVVLLCVIFLPSMKDFKNLFVKINNVIYVLIYTIFTILFYTLISPDIINNYYYIINPLIFSLGALAFYKGSKNSMNNFNINYERIKMLILLFCFISLIITFYNINPGGSAEKYFGYSLLLTIIIAVFAFLYLIILITIGNEQNDTLNKSNNLLKNFSQFGVNVTSLFIIFLIVTTVTILYNKESFFADKVKSTVIIILLLIICIIWCTMIGINKFSDIEINKITDLNKFSLLKKSLLVLFGLVISGLIIFWLSYNIESLSGKSSIISFILNILIVVIILSFIYKTINVNIPFGNSKKNAFFNLIFNILLYIPFLVSDIFDSISKMIIGEYNNTNTSSLIMLIISILLIITYLKIPSLLNFVNTQGGKQLLNKSISTNTQYNLGNYIDLNNGSDTYDYQFAISFWIFIDSMPPNTNSNYTKFTSLLNFGNKPNILYNSSKNTLMITVEQKDLKNITKNKLIDFDDNGNRIIYLDHNLLLQKWNNIIINYNGGTLDIFINGELVKSSIEVIPYYTYDNLTVGDNNGIEAGICNVVYFRKPLTVDNIYYIYNSVKNKNPPLID